MTEVSAILIGFLGSFHCLAMCGPIVLTMSASEESGISYYARRLLYNAGRVFTYMILGLVAGAIGHTFLLSGFQKGFSVGIGILIILTVVLFYFSKKTGASTSGLFIKLNGFIRSVFRKTIHRKDSLSRFVSGMANGILPCGFVYLALAGAAATQQIFIGAIYMAFFGLGTIPAMMAVAFLGKTGGLKTRSLINRLSPVLMILLGIFFIYKGVTMPSGTCPMHQQVNLMPF
jgi:sulfite exporter TauE/SafE